MSPHFFPVQKGLDNNHLSGLPELQVVLGEDSVDAKPRR